MTCAGGLFQSRRTIRGGSCSKEKEEGAQCQCTKLQPQRSEVHFNEKASHDLWGLEAGPQELPVEE